MTEGSSIRYRELALNLFVLFAGVRVRMWPWVQLVRVYYNLCYIITITDYKDTAREAGIPVVCNWQAYL